MRRSILLLTLALIGCWGGPGLHAAAPAHAQKWTASGSLGLTGGYSTNPYLDPTLGAWDPDLKPAFAALGPRVRLARTGGPWRLTTTAQARWFPRRDGGLQWAQGAAAGYVDLAPRWTLGLVGGDTRYRLQAARDTWWLLPTLRVRPTDGSEITLHAGISQRVDRSFTTTDRQTSALLTLSGRTWLTDRLSGMLRLYRTAGQTSVADVPFGGTGAEVRATYWPSTSVSIEGSVGAERLTYTTATSDGTSTQATDKLLQGGLEARWEATRTVSVFARSRGLTAALSRSTADDVHVAAGVRVRLQRSFGAASEPSPPRQVCHADNGRVTFRLPYDGDGTPHLTGDFTGWSTPGVPLSPADDDLWTTTLDLPPGRHSYRIRVVTDDGARWLDIPPYAPTTDDSFGGTNGVCIVP